MKSLLIFLLLPLQLLSQDIVGVWTGTIYNDTTRKYIPYEIAITESKGRLTGYSHTIFTGENNRQETGVKSLKIKKKGGKILIEDDELIYNNYTEPPPKGVRQHSVLNLTSGPSGEYLVGVFNTNRTKEYASLTGTINLQKKEKITDTKLIPKLDELNLSNSLSFTQPGPENKNIAVLVSPIKKEVPVSQPKPQQKDVAINLPKKESNAVVRVEKNENLIDINEDTIDYKVDVIETDIASKKKQKPADKTTAVTVKKPEAMQQSVKQTVIIPEIRKPPVLQSKKEIAVVSKKEEKKPEPLSQPKEKATVAVISKPQNKQDVISETSKKENVINTTHVNKQEAVTIPKEKPQTNKKETVVNTSPTVIKPEVVTVPKERSRDEIVNNILKPVQNSNIVSGPAISSEELGKRKIETIRSVDFKSDSIILTLYDNGVIDGDTVSILLNGKVIMSKQRLTEKASTKTIYITPDLGDSLQLIMFAENLGSIAPNTGLLIIKDGEDSYQIRFAGDLQKNSAIILRRKRN